jgi:hypothetical protein
MVTLLSRYVNNLRKDRRAQRSPARQTLRPPQRALAAIPKRSLVICTPPEARGSILKDCDHLWRAGGPHRETGANKGSICRYNMLDFLPIASPLQARERCPHPSAWKVNSQKFALTEFSEVHERPRASWRVGGLPGPTSCRRRAGSPTVAQ